MKTPRKRKGTETSSFGAPGRVNHNATSFYHSRLYANLEQPTPDAPDSAALENNLSDANRADVTQPGERVMEIDQPGREYIENQIPGEVLDTVLCKSSQAMVELPDNSVHLMVTSPPYNVGKEYDVDLTLAEYLDGLQQVWKEVLRVLVPGGRMCINVANLGRKPYIPLHVYLAEGALALGFQMRGELIWNKAASASPSTAWGSWQSAANPTLRDVHEYILVFCKGSYRRQPLANRENTITKEQFLEYTKSVWTFPAESARKIGHPAPFPIELPSRLIQLYTFAGDVVLDPFMGSGQTAIAARKAGRHYIGYEVKPQYVELAKQRIADF